MLRLRLLLRSSKQDIDHRKVDGKNNLETRDLKYFMRNINVGFFSHLNILESIYKHWSIRETIPYWTLKYSIDVNPVVVETQW